jgi:hypothetical protein
VPSAFFSRGGLQQAIQRRVYEFTPCYFGLNWKNRRIDLLSFQLEARPKGDLAMRGDLLALKVALAPCVIGYAEIATRLASRPEARAATNPYRVWIAEYAGAPYQEVAVKARAHLESLADLYATPAREAELIAIFKEATRLEADFWEMGWRAGQHVE